MRLTVSFDPGGRPLRLGGSGGATSVFGVLSSGAATGPGGPSEGVSTVSGSGGASIFTIMLHFSNKRPYNSVDCK